MIRNVTPVVVNVTEQQFFEKTNRKPVNDDLERVNCPIVDKMGHSQCGWNTCKDIPMFEGSNHKDDCKCD